MTLPSLPVLFDTSFAWLSPDTVQTLGWTLIHFLWQGMALALLFQAVAMLCRTACARYNLGCAVLAAMAVAPVVTFMMLRSGDGGLADPIPMGAAVDDETLQAMSGAVTVTASPWLHWLVMAWFAGVVALSLRVAGGWYLADALRRRETAPLPPALRARFEALRAQLGISRPVRFLQSALVAAPAVVGWLRPVVLVPASAVMGLTPVQLEAVIVHELAHIRRFDALANLLQMAVETALFYHPAVWWISRRIRVEREHCCDDVAVATSGDALNYARALAQLEEWRAEPLALPVMAASGGVLKHRISRLLGLNIRGGNFSVMGVAGVGVICLIGCVVAQGADADAGNAATRPFPGLALMAVEPPAPPEVPVPAPVLAITPTLIVPPVTPELPSLDDIRVVPRLPKDWFAPVKNDPADSDDGLQERMRELQMELQRELVREQADLAREQVQEAREHVDEARQQLREEARDRMREMERGRSRHPEVATRPEDVPYIAGMAEAGLKGLDADEVRRLKALGVTPEYVKEINASGVRSSLRQILSFKAQGLDAAYIRDVRAAGIDPSAPQLLALSAQGITPAYIRDIHAAWPDASAAHIIALNSRGVTPDYIKSVRAVWSEISLNDMVAMSTLGVSPGDAAAYRKSGLADLTVRQMFSYKTVGVTPDFVRALKAAGIKDLSQRDYTTAKVRGITPEFLDAVRKHGFANLTMRQLIALKDADVL